MSAFTDLVSFPLRDKITDTGFPPMGNVRGGIKRGLAWGDISTKARLSRIVDTLSS
jgi:hypothetical protein